MDDVTTETKPSTRVEVTKDDEQKKGADAAAQETERLRARLHDLWSAPIRDMAAIDEVMAQLDQVHAASKSQTRTDDHQRY
jgi:hypothetical protein